METLAARASWLVARSLPTCGQVRCATSTFDKHTSTQFTQHPSGLTIQEPHEPQVSNGHMWSKVSWPANTFSHFCSEDCAGELRHWRVALQGIGSGEVHAKADSVSRVDTKAKHYTRHTRQRVMVSQPSLPVAVFKVILLWRGIACPVPGRRRMIKNDCSCVASYARVRRLGPGSFGAGGCNALAARSSCTHVSLLTASQTN